MKSIYQKILELLETVTTIKFIDLDNGQLETGTTAVAFPCVLVNLSIPDIEDVTDRIQRARCRIILRIGFQPYKGQTANITPASVRTQSLEYLDLVDQVCNVMQGYTDTNYEGITRVGIQPEQRADGLRVIQLAFDCRYEENFE